MNTEYTVHFQKGTRVGARSLRMEQITAANVDFAVALALSQHKQLLADGYRLIRVDHFGDDGRLVIDI